MDPRIEKLAELLVSHSIKLKKNEKVLIDAYDVPETIVLALVRSVRKKGGLPFVQIQRAVVIRELIKNGTVEQLQDWMEVELNRMKRMDAYIAIRGAQNIFETSDIPAAKMKEYSKASKAVLDYRVKKTKWVVLRWPTPSMAQQSQKSTEAFEDFFFDACTMDYSRMVAGMKALKKLMEKTDKVRIAGPGTDLTFSIKNIGAVTCGGDRNIPDGEVFSAPVKTSVNGVISYNTPTVYQGCSFDNIVFEFKDGKIIKASGSNTKRLHEILDTDEGARYIGEFAIGFHPTIKEPMRDILFDEKISGSFHFTPGQAYEEADNGNHSQIHWDLVSIQRKDYGGGEIWFDGKLIRKDGIFVEKSLEKLNPEYLLGKEK